MNNMPIRDFYKQKLSRLETPEFVHWFESWHGTENDFLPHHESLCDMYWSERRFALLGWHAAKLPENVSGDNISFVRSLGIQP